MNQEESLKVLGLESNASTFDISNASANKMADLHNKISSAPTDALKVKFQQLIDKVELAERVLSEPVNQTRQSQSPLSETKMADLPGMQSSAGSDETAQALQPGTTLLDRYEIKQHLAQGGMGAVYRAFDKNRGEDIAIKVMLPQLMKNDSARERFLAEARLSSQLSHPNIVNVYDVQQENGLYFLTMELLEGQDLRELMNNRKLVRQPFTKDDVVEILAPICAALDYAHEYTVHRDIKPENIFLTEDGRYKLMDFGIARVMSASQRTQTGAASGTAYYMSPEQLKGTKTIDGRADQYALAVLAYELLSEEVPAGAIEPLHEVVKGLDKKLSAAVQKALSPKAENRFDSLAEFLDSVQGNGKKINMPNVQKISMPGIQKKGMVIGLLLIIGAGFTGLGYLERRSALDEIEVLVYSIHTISNDVKGTYGFDIYTTSDIKIELTRFNSSLAQLSSKRGSYYLNNNADLLIDEIGKQWTDVNVNVQLVNNGKQTVAEMKELRQAVDSFIPQMIEYSDEVVGMLTKTKSSKRQIYLATRQMMLAGRIKENLAVIVDGDSDLAPAAADRFGRDAALFGRVLEGLLKGSKGLQIEKVVDKKTVSKLREVAMMISAVSDNIAGILELTPVYFDIKDSRTIIETQLPVLVNKVDDLRKSLE